VRLHHEAETTKRRIAEVRRQAEAAAAAAAEHAERTAEASRREEARHARIRDDEARASAIAAERTRLAAAHALAEARELEHKLAVQTATALKVEQDKALARAHAAKESAATLAAREQVFAAAREQNALLTAELAHTMQVAQQTTDIEAARTSAVVKAAEREAAEAASILARDEADYLHLQAKLTKVQKCLAATRTPSAASPPVHDGTALTPTVTAQGADQSLCGSHRPSDRGHSGGSSSSRDRESTPRRRSEEPPRPRLSRSPLGMGHYTDARAKEHMKSKRLEDEDARRESSRAAAVEQKREQSPILTPDLHAILNVADADRTTKGLSAHTLSSFLTLLQEQGHFTQAAHQNEAPQDHMEQDLHSNPGRSQGAPSSGHCQRGQQ
jgi:hypothetical protein